MTGSILYDGYHVGRPGGTGLATYAREVQRTARELGYRTDSILSVDFKVDKNHPHLAEIGLFDGRSDGRFKEVWATLRRMRSFFGAPFGVGMLKLRVRGGVVEGGGLSDFDHVYVGKRVYDRGRANFSRYGSFGRLAVPKGPLLYHATFPLPMRVTTMPTILTIHDLIPLRVPYTTLDNKRFYFRMIREAARVADHIVTVSERSKQDIIEILGVPEDKITNTYQAVNIPHDMLTRSMEDVERDLRNAFGLEPGSYYLFYGAIEPKKNIGRLVDAFSLSGTKRQLILAGGLGWQFKDDLARVDDERFLGLRMDQGHGLSTAWIDRRVRRLPYVTFDLLTSLIKGARAVVFPSIYEGFGLPVIESMALGTPVLTSNNSSLPEVAGDAARLVNPYDIRDIARGIQDLDTDDGLVRELAAKGLPRAELFSTDKYARRLEQVYDRFIPAAQRVV